MHHKKGIRNRFFFLLFWTQHPILASSHLAHLVRALSTGRPGLVLSLEGVVELDVEVATVLVVGLDLQVALDLLALVDGDDLVEVKDGLLPVGVLCVGARGEADGLVAGGKLNVEPRHQRVNEVVAPGRQAEGYAEGQVGRGALVQVEGQDGGGVRDDGLDVDRVDQGLRQGRLLERRVVEAVDVVPEANLLVLVLAVLDPGGVDDGLVGEDEAVLDQVPVAGVQDRVEHALVQQKVSHPL